MDRDDPPSKQPPFEPPRWLLVSDVDDTLVGDDEALSAFLAAIDGIEGFILALNSSRPIASIQHTLYELNDDVKPRVIIGAMGTEIVIDGREDRAWQKRFVSFDRGPIDEVMHDLGCEPHDEPLQTPFKASFVVPKALQQQAIEAVNKTGVRTRIIHSGESDFDVLPENADKGHATLYVADCFKVPHTHLIVAGDSANDLAMFDAAKHGIVVGNARDELRHAVDGRASGGGGASGGDVYFAKEHRAAGLLEGLQHFGVPVRMECKVKGAR